MLFNSYVFLFVFLPVTLLGYQIAGMFHRRAVIAWLGVMSLVFYAHWHASFLIVLVGSILINYTMAALISRKIPNGISTFVLLWTAILLNLGILGYFKYLYPFLGFVARVTGSGHAWHSVALPLGISFFTFTQIAYLVDLQQGVAKHQDPISYLLFVTFFPHLIAGPILHHKEMMPQFQQDRRYALSLPDVTVGFSWFLMGLGKKTLIADVFAKHADAAFAATGHLNAGAAWVGALSYALQLYFDFSGYSDMALGLARMFSIDFPLNFNSPHKSTSIIEFWTRWHMTLSSYIMDYLYSPVQFLIRGRRRAAGKPVNRASLQTPGGFAAMIAFPMLFTMFIAGIWHGAGLQFIVFGLLHGLFLTINHAWRVFRPNRPADAAPLVGARMWFNHVACVLLTFACVLLGQIFFRADSVHAACALLGNMFGWHTAAGHSILTTDTRVDILTRVAEVTGGFAILWGLPNTQQILRDFKPSLQWAQVLEDRMAAWPRWKPTLGWALALSIVLIASLSSMQNPSTFLYFQF